MTVLSGGHMAVDFANGSLLALLPYLKDRFHLSYTLTAVLLLASTFASSIVQPLFGLWSDRRGALWLLPDLKDRFHLSYTLTAVLLLASTFASSIVQPLFGLWSDRRGALWLLP